MVAAPISYAVICMTCMITGPCMANKKGPVAITGMDLTTDYSISYSMITTTITDVAATATPV